MLRSYKKYKRISSVKATVILLIVAALAVLVTWGVWKLWDLVADPIEDEESFDEIIEKATHTVLDVKKLDRDMIIGGLS